jgi:hypothetical protein
MNNRDKEILAYAYALCGIVMSFLVGIYCGVHHGYLALIYGVTVSVLLFSAVAPVFIKIANWVVKLKRNHKGTEKNGT